MVSEYQKTREIRTISGSEYLIFRCSDFPNDLIDLTF